MDKDKGLRNRIDELERKLRTEKKKYYDLKQTLTARNREHEQELRKEQRAYNTERKEVSHNKNDNLRANEYNKRDADNDTTRRLLNETRDTLQQTRNDNEVQLKTLTDEIKCLQSKLHYQNETNRREKLMYQTEKDSLNTIISQLNADIQNKRDRFLEQVADKQRQIEQLESQNSEIENHVVFCEKKQENVTVENHELKQINSDRENKIKELIYERTNLSQLVEQLRTENDNLLRSQERIKQMISEMEDVLNDNNELCNEVKRLKSEQCKLQRVCNAQVLSEQKFTLENPQLKKNIGHDEIKQRTKPGDKRMHNVALQSFLGDHKGHDLHKHHATTVHSQGKSIVKPNNGIVHDGTSKLSVDIRKGPHQRETVQLQLPEINKNLGNEEGLCQTYGIINRNGIEVPDLKRDTEDVSLNATKFKINDEQSRNDFNKMKQLKEKLDEDVTILRAELETKRTEMDTLQRQNDVCKSREFDYKRNAKCLEKINSDLKQQKISIEKELCKIRVHLDDIKNENMTKLRAELETKTTEMDKLQRQYDVCKSREFDFERNVECLEKINADISQQKMSLEKEFRKVCTQLEHIQNENLEFQKSFSQLQSEYLSELNVIESKNRNLKHDVQTLQKQNEEIKKNIELREVTIKENFERRELENVALLKEKQAYLSENNQLKERMNQKEDDYKQLKKKYLKIKEDLHNKMEEELAKGELNSKREIHTNDTDYVNLKADRSNLKIQLEQANNDLREARLELDDTKTSKLMGQKLTDNNPNIADLSDKNRPTKLAERFTELYDNQWTDAFEVIDSGNEQETIGVLILILNATMQFCRTESDEQMEKLRAAVTLSDISGVEKIPDLLNKQLKDCRKAAVEQSEKHMHQKYLEKLQISESQIAQMALQVRDFQKECFEICWLMSIQDPPVVLGPELKHGHPFNTDIYKAYTRSSPTVDYIVWPALYLYQGGAILCKGVAQGFGERKKKHN